MVMYSCTSAASATTVFSAPLTGSGYASMTMSVSPSGLPTIRPMTSSDIPLSRRPCSTPDMACFNIFIEAIADMRTCRKCFGFFAHGRSASSSAM